MFTFSVKSYSTFTFPFKFPTFSLIKYKAAGNKSKPKRKLVSLNDILMMVMVRMMVVVVMMTVMMISMLVVMVMRMMVMMMTTTALLMTPNISG